MKHPHASALRHCLATGLLACLGALGQIVASPARAAVAPQPTPLPVLFDRLPALPTGAPEAAQWFDTQGRLIHPGMLALQADIRAHQRALEPLAAALGERGRAQGQRTVDNIGHGLGSAGIDMGRMPCDPAYAEQVQARLQQMSPQQALALATAMSRPGNADAGQRNAADDAQADPPAVRAAAQAGQSYVQATSARVRTHTALLRDLDSAVTQLMARPLRVAAARPAIVWDDPACEPGCRAQWQRHAKQLQPLMQARAAEVLHVRRATLGELATLFGDMQQKAPAPVFATLLGLAQGQLSAPRQAQLHRSLGLPPVLGLVSV